MIKSAVPSDPELYLTVEDGLCENALIVASPFPASWNIEVDHEEGTMQYVRLH